MDPGRDPVMDPGRNLGIDLGMDPVEFPVGIVWMAEGRIPLGRGEWWKFSNC